jgi:hypothetical protein
VSPGALLGGCRLADARGGIARTKPGEANVAELAEVTSMAMERPCEWMMARAVVLRPPHERPIVCASVPFSARRRAVRFGGRVVDGLTIRRDRLA